MPVNLSQSQILNFIQCPKRFWLEQYHPEHEGDVSAMDACLDAEEAADARARSCFGEREAIRINGRLGLRKAIEQTTESLSAGTVVLDATFEFDGISAQVDVLDWTNTPYRAVSVSAATDIGDRQLDDCAIQAWAIGKLGLPEHRYFVALTKQPGDSAAGFEQQFEIHDVSEQISGRIAQIDTAIEAARAQHAALDEPTARTGSRCHVEYACPFLDYCEQAEEA